MNIDNYCLNLRALEGLEEKDKENIHSYYRDALYCHHDGRKEMSNSIMNTLLIGGYLIDVRENRIDGILDGNKG